MSWARELTAHATRVRDFTALLGVRDAEALTRVLAQQDQTQPYQGAYGIHALRWMLFDPAQTGSQHRLLVLAMIVDGTPGDVVTAFAQTKGEPLTQVLSHCHGFDASTSVADYLKERATPSGFLFRDLGPLGTEPEPDATLVEIEHAHQERLHFEDFYRKYWKETPDPQLRAEFEKQFVKRAFPFPLTPFEKRQPDEQTWVRRMIDVGCRRQAVAAANTTDGKRRRAVHAKAHGLIRATFRVRRSAFSIGLFGREGTYAALLRPSNSAPAPTSDRAPDARGMALRVMIAPGQRLADGQLPSFLEPRPLGAGGNQDFVLMDSRVFFARDIQRLALLGRVFASGGKLDKVVGLAGLALGPGGLRELGLFAGSLLGLTRDPLAKRYHSTTPYLLGPHHIAKYSLEPVEEQPFLDWARDWRVPSTAEILRQRLSKGGVRLRFFVHVFSERQRPNGMSLQDIVEDATLDWRWLKAKKVHVADVEIPQQDPTTEESMRQAEALQFNPWHALEAHRPLGSLNRARWSAYPASQQFRAEQAAAVAAFPELDPRSASEPPSIPAPTSAPASVPKAAE